MKKAIYFFLFVFLFTTILFPSDKPRIQVQKNSFSLVLNFTFKHTDENIGKFTLRKYADASDEISSLPFLLPTKDILIAIPANSKPQFRVVSVDSKTFNDVVPVKNSFFWKDKSISYNTQPNNKLFQLVGYTWIRDFFCAHVKIFPVTYDGLLKENYKITITVELPGTPSLKESSPIEIKSPYDASLSDMIYNSQIAEQLRNTNAKIYPDTTGGWIDYNSLYVKIPIFKDGIYRVTRSGLESIGVDVSSIDCTTFRLFESGKEIPLYVEGERDGKLDSTDFIEFYGTKNYSKKSYRTINADGEPYNPFINLYTDTSFYFLTWGGQKGKRILVSSESYSMISDTLNFHTAFEHFEVDAGFGGLSTDLMKNQDPHWIETDLWYWGGISSGSQVNFSFDAINRIPNRTAKFYLKIIGSASGTITNAHNLNLILNSEVIDSKIISRNERAQLRGTVNSSRLMDGTNTLTLKNIENGNTPNSVVYDWYDVEYSQKLAANNNFLQMNFLNDITPGIKFIKIENFTLPKASVYKLTPQYKRIVNFSIKNGILLFEDTVSAGDKYVVFTDNKVNVPVLNKTIKFLNLRDTNYKYDDIIITNSSLRNSGEEYSQFINSNYSIRAKTFYTNDIFNEFGYGYSTPESIQEFLKYAYQNWQSPKPSYVLLIGSANYDCKNIFKKPRLNLVPSYGEPVSDTWYTTWDDTAIPLQQMWIGRIPASTDEEVRFYLNKHRGYLSQRYTSFNKAGIFFSGGDPNVPGQIESFKNVNDYVKNNITDVAPYFMSGIHFYKTKSPRSDFGPYDTKFVRNTIKNGALFISYLGHSGTRVWDNSITQTSDLENDYSRNPLITDFGCSTAKFAEPDVDAFSNLFVLNSQAIAYIGNSSLGYTSTSLTAPKYFYESIFSDSIYKIARAHSFAKQKIFDHFGSGGAYRIFAFTNTFIGDPIVDLAVPTKPNFFISENDIELLSPNVNDQMGIVNVSFTIHNFGIQSIKPIKVLITDTYLGSVSFLDTLKILPPTNELTTTMSLPILNKPGRHNLLIKLDAANNVDEIYEDDNSASLTFDVISTKTRPYIYDRTASSVSEIIFLNPQKNFDSKTNLITEIDESPSFLKPIKYIIPVDTFYTKMEFQQLANGKRYWMRAKLGESDPSWEQIISFHKSVYPKKITYNDSLSESLLGMEHLSKKGSSITISTDTSLISIESAGGNFMKYGSIKLNRVNILPNTFNWGMGIAVFDSARMKIDTTDTIWYGDNPQKAHDLATLINSIPAGKIVAMCAIDDASSNLILELREAIKTLGSTLVDKIGFRNPWLLIGRKGAKPSEVIEKLETSSFQNILIAEKSFISKNENGKMTTDFIGPAALWGNAELNATLPSDSQIEFLALGLKHDGGIDTLLLYHNNGVIPLSNISSKKYPKIKMIGNFHLSKDGQSPTLNSFSIDFKGVPELGTNYQALWMNRDTLIQGEKALLSFYVYNVGEARADSFKVCVEVVKPDNSREKIFEQMVDSLGAAKRKLFNVSYNTTACAGNSRFYIIIDPNNKLVELYKDNNQYSVPFYVRANNSPAALKLLFDDNDILNGDYISSNPTIRIELSDQSLIPITDTSHIQLYLNNRRIFLSNKEISFVYSENNPKFIVNYKPVLKDGAYTLKILGTNATGQLIDSTGAIRKFNVSNQAHLLYVYNYPNPFSSETYFTFKLTQIPDELRIKIFSVAGRLIKEINVPASNFNYDFNKVEWDGRDEDGNLVANGIYLYKVIMIKGSEIIQATQKLAVVR